jgi:acyl-CoA thioesterase-1
MPWFDCVAGCSGCVSAAGAAAPKTAVKTVLVLGDSLSAAHNIPVESGWVFLLDARYCNMVPKWTASMPASAVKRR